MILLIPIDSVAHGSLGWDPPILLYIRGGIRIRYVSYTANVVKMVANSISRIIRDILNARLDRSPARYVSVGVPKTM